MNINGAQLHLAINHMPVVLILVATVFLLWGWLGRSRDIQRAGLYVAIACAMFSGLAFWTGDPAEDVLKPLPGFSRSLVHEHEEAADFALWGSILCAAAAIAAEFLARRQHQRARAAYLTTLILCLWASTVFLRVAHLGGLIKHDEIRPADLNVEAPVNPSH